MGRTKLRLEYLFKASPTILYQFFTTPSCLVRWFCDEVDIHGNFYTFAWNGYTETAEIIDDIEEERVRFRWTEAEYDNEYLEFNITEAPVTGETILEVIDFCDNDELADQRQLWDTQIQRLQRETGSQD
ncbi:MAG: activator of HSP90 ATPase 1 family protein [Saprospiraceae bacterium]|nr:activator of HSP90 ATPase 1 family protein [Saprospiraceae bacterium]